MKKCESAFSGAAGRIGTAAKKTAEEYAKGRWPDEPNITAVLVSRIGDSLTGYAKGGITWSAKILSSAGANTEEKTFGADFLGVLELDLPDFRVKKGFLAQAKRQEPGTALPKKEWERLKEQCNKMLNYSPESFVFIYAFNGVYVVSAISVAACVEAEDLHTLQPKTMSGFYKEHFRCYVGDRGIDSATPMVLDNLAAQFSLIVSASVSANADLFAMDDS